MTVKEIEEQIKEEERRENEARENRTRLERQRQIAILEADNVAFGDFLHTLFCYSCNHGSRCSRYDYDYDYERRSEDSNPWIERARKTREVLKSKGLSIEFLFDLLDAAKGK